MPVNHVSKPKHAKAVEARRAAKASEATKSVRLLSISDFYNDLFKEMNPEKVRAYHADAARRVAPDPSRTMHVDKPKPTVADVASRTKTERRGATRKPKPTISMKPISNEEAMQHLRSGTYSPSQQKSLLWLAALKALATGYGKVSEGGALKAGNRGAGLPLLGPSGRAAGKPGGYYRPRRRSGKQSFGVDGRPGRRDRDAKFGSRPKISKTYAQLTTRPTSASSDSPRAVDAGGATELSNSAAGVVIKSGGAEMPSNVNFNDLFKSELEADDVLVACPHCEEPITKSDLTKAHKGKGAVTHQSGKRGKSSAHVRDHNPEGGAMRGGEGRGVHTPSRGVPGAKKHDEPVGVQNSKGSHARKGGADSSADEDDDGVDKAAAGERDQAGARSRPTGSADPGAEVKKSVITIRGTPFVQYIDDGSDAAIAKSILDGSLGGTPPTQPMDLNNDLSRLLT